MTKKIEYNDRLPFINRKAELNYLHGAINRTPNEILFIYGPKSSGKTTLLMKFIELNLNEKHYNIKHLNLRKVLIVNYIDFIQAFFEVDYSSLPKEVKQRSEYSHEDRSCLDEIVSHLYPLKHENIDVWFDDRIMPGEQWSPAIINAIQTSHMTICLISKHYLNSDFIRTRELPLIKAKRNEGMHVFPLLIENCSWKVIKWLKNMQIFPKDAIPLKNMNNKEQDNALIKFVDHINDTFEF